MHTSLVFRKGAPDKLLISGKFQKQYCEKHLGWPKKRVFNVGSFRYSKNNFTTQNNSIFLPYAISKPKAILNSLSLFLKNSKKIHYQIFLSRIILQLKVQVNICY